MATKMCRPGGKHRQLLSDEHVPSGVHEELVVDLRREVPEHQRGVNQADRLKT